MLTNYLKRIPTLIVIGVTGYAVSPIFFPDTIPAPTKSATKPPPKSKPPEVDASIAIRDPFQVDKPIEIQTADTTSLVASSKAEKPTRGESPTKGTTPTRGEKPGKAEDRSIAEDRILEGMTLSGTFIDGREQLAVINNKVYARGEKLKAADGSILPYVITEIRKDRALIRRDRRNFEIAFSNDLRVAVASAKNPTKTSAKSNPTPPPPTPNRPAADSLARSDRKKGESSTTRTGDSPLDSPAAILQILSTVAGAGAGRSGGLGGGSPNVPINADTLAAGIDSLIGKFDSIGRGGNEIPLSNLPGGTTP